MARVLARRTFKMVRKRSGVRLDDHHTSVEAHRAHDDRAEMPALQRGNEKSGPQPAASSSAHQEHVVRVVDNNVVRVQIDDSFVLRHVPGQTWIQQRRKATTRSTHQRYSLLKVNSKRGLYVRRLGACVSEQALDRMMKHSHLLSGLVRIGHVVNHLNDAAVAA
jgi:hypothetical protein